MLRFDVSTLYFETDAGDGFREPGFSKERRLEPQITLGLLTDASGFPLTVQAFEGNRAETATMLPVINAFKQAHQLTGITVVADAAMISEANQVAIQAAGLSFILGTRIPHLPDVVRRWRYTHPDTVIPDHLVLTQPWPSTSAEKSRGIPDRVIYYQFRHDRARRTLRGIDEQVAKAQRAVDGHAPVKRNRYIHLLECDQERESAASCNDLTGWVRGWGVAGRRVRCGRGGDCRCVARSGIARSVRCRCGRAGRRPIRRPGCGETSPLCRLSVAGMVWSAGVRRCPKHQRMLLSGSRSRCRSTPFAQ